MQMGREQESVSTQAFLRTYHLHPQSVADPADQSTYLQQSLILEPITKLD